MCTDAAAEGLNLQTADFLVNFDLPWNPAKVEQRIGRIDRIGQRHQDIHIQNLCYLGSVDYGEPVFDAILAMSGDWPAPGCVRPISVIWKELEACRKLVAERLAQGGGMSVQRIPVMYERVATAFVPFAVKRKISDDSFWVDRAPPPLLNAALDAAAQVGEGIKKKKSELSTDLVLSKIASEMKHILMTGS